MRKIIRQALKNGSAVILVLLMLVGIVFVRNFATIDNGAIIARQSAIPAIAVLGMTMVLMTGGIDLSLGFVVGLASIATVSWQRSGVYLSASPWPPRCSSAPWSASSTVPSSSI